MKNWQEIIQHTTFRYIDHTNKKFFYNTSFTALTSFAIDDALATSVSAGTSSPAIRLWVHPKTVVLGIPDSRLPYLADGVRILKNQGYHVVVRNSGGLAVVLDRGILNVSLILPDVKHLSIHECYEAMVSLVRTMLSDVTTDIQAYEIVGSYCPGDYDLSIHGKKFAGISQRRIKDAAAIQIYLDVDGNSFDRANTIRQFYQQGIKGEATKFDYPTVQPETMASLKALLGISIHVEEMKTRVMHALRNLSKTINATEAFSKEELEVFQTRYKQMLKRNEQINRLLQEQ